MRVEQMEQIINYRDIPTDKRIDILNALERIGFFPAYGGVKTMQQIMEKSVPGSGPQFYFVFRENELIGYNFLIVRKHMNFEELTHTLLREFVEKIVVHECSYDENGTRRQDIEIYYSFVGKVDLPE